MHLSLSSSAVAATRDVPVAGRLLYFKGSSSDGKRRVQAGTLAGLSKTLNELLKEEQQQQEKQQHQQERSAACSVERTGDRDGKKEWFRR